MGTFVRLEGDVNGDGKADVRIDVQSSAPNFHEIFGSDLKF